MKRIAYLVHLDVSKETGILKKISEQVKSWISSGYEVKIFALSPSRDIWSGFADIGITLVLDRGIRYRLFDSANISAKIMSWRADIVYLRFEKNYPAFQWLAKRIPTILEINTDDIQENSIQLSFISRLYHSLTRKGLIRACAGMVFVTYELQSRLNIYDKPSVVIGNGIQVKRLRTHRQISKIQSNPSTPTLIFIGSEGYAWHGIEKIIFLAARKPDWLFNVIGIRRPDFEVPKNIIFYGPLPFEDYIKYLNSANVAIGTLSLHTKNMDEASPLKTREYLAFGIPTIIGYIDTDYMIPSKYILQLGNYKDNVADNLDIIDNFVSENIETIVPIEEVERLDVEVKEKYRIVFFETIMRS